MLIGFSVLSPSNVLLSHILELVKVQVLPLKRLSLACPFIRDYYYSPK